MLITPARGVLAAVLAVGLLAGCSSDAATPVATPAGDPLENSVVDNEPQPIGGAVRVGEIDVHVEERVPADQTHPTVLFLHGAAFDADVWVRTGILDAVAAQGSWAVAVDLPGFGRTPRSELDQSAFLAALIAVLDDGNGIVVVSPSMSGSFSLPLIASAGAESMAGYVPVAPVGISSFVGSLATPIDDLPTLIVWGSDDGVDNGPADALAAALTDSELVVIDDAGHAAYQDQPEAFIDALMAFVQTLTVGS